MLKCFREARVVGSCLEYRCLMILVFVAVLETIDPLRVPSAKNIPIL